MTEEIWKDIEKYEGLYQVSSLGNVRRLPGITTRKQHNSPKIIKQPVKERILKSASSTKTGYSSHNLCKNGICTPIYTHKLVAETFLEKPNISEERLCVRHKDNNPKNASLDNLEYGTYKDNARDRYKHGTDARGENNPARVLTTEKVIELKTLLKSKSIKEASSMLGINYSTARSINQGKRWGWVSV